MSYKPNLEKGDFIAVALAGAYIDLGWFVGFGKNSMLYYSMWSPYSHKGFCEARKIPMNIKRMRECIIVWCAGRPLNKHGVCFLDTIMSRH